MRIVMPGGMRCMGSRRMRHRCALKPWLAAVAIALLGSSQAIAKSTSLDGRLHHLRAGEQREWSDFPAKAEGSNLTLSFQSEGNAGEWSLRLRQQDVKQTWKVLLNGKELGRLLTDENDTIIYLPIPAGRVTAGENQLLIEQVGRTPDDIRVGEITLDERPVAAILGEGAVEVSLLEEGKPLPCRLTVLNEQGALMTVGAATGGKLAVRPGVLYTGD